MTPDELLGAAASGSILEQFAVAHPDRFPAAWDADPAGPRLYRAFAARLIARGHPAQGLGLAGRGVAAYPGDAELRYLVALGFARGGKARSAGHALDPLLRERLAGPPGLDRLSADVVALRGRLLKDRYRRDPDPALAAESTGWYEAAAARAPDPTYPLVNAATMRRLAGDLAAARRHAAAVLAAVRLTADDYWALATAGEAELVAGNLDAAGAHFDAAVGRMIITEDYGSLAALIGNLRLLAAAGVGGELDWIHARLGSVVVYSGHRIDPPGAAVRFPDDPALVGRVRAAVRAELAAMNARFAFGSLAGGADVLFAEELLNRGADLQVVLPCAADDFRRTSVDYDRPELRHWADRAAAVLGRLRPDQIHHATEEPYLGSGQLFAYTNEVIQGMALVRAAQFGFPPEAVVVLDPAATPNEGGTRHFRDVWTAAGRPCRTIDLEAVRGFAAARSGRSGDGREPPPASLPRPIRAMLFADVAAFSRMREEFAPAFFTRFSDLLAAALAAAGPAALMANTWGDGFFAVFPGAVEAAEFATDLLARFEAAAADWQAVGFPDPNPLRVGLHVGPVFERADNPVLKGRNVFGRHVNRAARIEPVTTPGCVYASEQCAAQLAVRDPGRFACDFVGVEQLPKGGGPLPLFRVSPAASRG
ncbi:adenylate/guanylate cyclase domain-containing protein [Urbifossiella limnaea]|uniref:Adenylate and Guanylate cyclase catalytic domain protein n=1 Tax=Urbifossiella limnaea TaxID=2528023 RepID=A0A517XZU9_9BACT|nr:adenylate/guanylate cyclase domain-containing protein [Urbifossiella limnaea]QDU23034.1 Adenylate and Guanylate cyclase catalytic domain protein [Urbifossiella limnaea]